MWACFPGRCGLQCELIWTLCMQPLRVIHRSTLILNLCHARHSSPTKRWLFLLQLKLLSSDQDQTQLQSWRMQDTLLAMLILLSAVAAITLMTAELGTKVIMLAFDIQ